jgi:hypothetical protein
MGNFKYQYLVPVFSIRPSNPVPVSRRIPVLFLKMTKYPAEFPVHLEVLSRSCFCKQHYSVVLSALKGTVILFIGEEQTAEDAEDGPPELLFIHGGHTAKISG